ncbi:hypothetical protein CALCODRAFT_42721 [Calocera cornea HHB12733]|uniref:Uncharacterized protein n=1 Tax=Calocera cornea HHB12733 TaxID=1353952 RepID=A0A165DVF8_9BASI|nr:hypothetical protein CALCODRAFT_42721 [Calocera cornea HHB12733]
MGKRGRSSSLFHFDSTRRAMTPRHTERCSSSSSDSVINIDSDDETDSADEFRPQQSRVPARRKAVGRASTLATSGRRPLARVSVNVSDRLTRRPPPSRRRNSTTAIGSGPSAADHVQLPLWKPGCNGCKLKTVQHECRAWPGQTCTICQRHHKKCNLSGTRCFSVQTTCC